MCPILLFMTGNEFIRRIRRLGRQRGIKVEFVPERGKGSHGTLYFGDRLTIVRNPKDELKTGTLHGMLAQLGLTRTDL
jgi:mRNA interferase HicA